MPYLHITSCEIPSNAERSRYCGLFSAVFTDFHLFERLYGAPDADPGFRRRFYEEILPELSRQGLTLVVVSHDDRYFHTADRVLRVGDGLVSR